MTHTQHFYYSPRQQTLRKFTQRWGDPELQVMLHLDGTYSTTLLEQTIEKVVQKHAALRTYYGPSANSLVPVQTVQDYEAGRLCVKVRKGGKEMAREVMKLPMDGHPFTATIITDDNTASIVLQLSAYAADLQSLAVLCEDIEALLTGSFGEVGEEDLAYTEFSQWQEELLQQPETINYGFWNDYPVSLQSFSFARSNDPQQGETAIWNSGLSRELLYHLQQMHSSKREIALASAWAFILSRHCGNEAVTLGLRSCNRYHEELNTVVGALGTTLPVTFIPPAGNYIDGFFEMAEHRIKEVLMNQYAYTGMQDFWPVTFSYFSSNAVSIDRIEQRGLREGICLQVTDFNGLLSLQFIYNESLYSEKEIICLYRQLVDSLCDMTGISTRYNLPPAPAITATPSFFTVPEALQSLVNAYPDKVALSFNENIWTFSTLSNAVQQVAGSLISQYDVKPGDRVAVLLDRSEWLVAILLGVMHTGACYVPLDTEDAPERQKVILEDCQARLLITNADLTDVTMPVVDPEQLRVVTSQMPLPQIGGTDIAYMIYTSGTSGRPKGVPVKHTSLMHYTHWIQQAFEIGIHDRTALFTSHAFDLCYTSLWAGLLNGAAVYIIPAYLVQMPAVFVQYLSMRKVTYLKATPSFIHLLLQESGAAINELLADLRCLFLGGEKYRVADLSTIWSINPGLQLVNHYGPTETTIGVATHRFLSDRLADYSRHCIIGTPAANHAILILDAHLQPCAPGMKGEICITGPGLSDGYFGIKQHSARFLDYGQPAVRIYRTGDEGWINADGELVITNRMDKQVKLNGFRVELSEIETAISSLEGITDALAVLDVRNGNPVLTGYYVGMPVDFNQARALLSQRLPAYMLPAALIRIPAIPLTINGKIDYTSLPVSALPAADEWTAPETEMELQLAAIWEEVLAKKELSVTDNFFHLGGDSIKAIQIASRLHARGYQIPVRDIFNYPNIRLMAGILKPLAATSVLPPFSGVMPMPPVFAYFFQHIKQRPAYYNQVALINVGNADEKLLEKIFGLLVNHHDILRLTFQKEEGKYIPVIEPGIHYPVITSSIPADGNELTEHASVLQGSFNLEDGPLYRLHLFHHEQGNQLLIILHHTVTDLVSWNILLEDLDNLLEQHYQQQELALPPAMAGYGHFATWLQDYAVSPSVKQQLHYWQKLPANTPMWVEFPGGSNRISDVVSHAFQLSEEETGLLLRHPHITSLLLAALSNALQQTIGTQELLIMLESHGRTFLDGQPPLDRTMGWFTALYPFLLPAVNQPIKDYAIALAGELNNVPDLGTGYGILRYLTAEGNENLHHSPFIRCNYLGNSNDTNLYRHLEKVSHSLGATEAAEEERPYMIDVIAYTTAGQFYFYLASSGEQYGNKTIARILDQMRETLLSLIADKQVAGLTTPIPVPGIISQEDLANFF